MDLVKRISYIGTMVVVSGLLAGCFSYHREVRETSTPAVESAPTSSTTSTTTTTDDGTVERRSTTTYSSNP
jgi:hypothetical protein